MEEVEANCAICCQYSRVQTCEKCEREVCSSDDCFNSMSGLCTYCKKAKERNLPMEQETMLLACKHISEPARKELKRAGCTIHKDVPGIDDLEIVELRYEGDADLNMMSVWGTPREIQIYSKNLHLFYGFEEEGYKLEGGKLVEDQEPEPEYDDLLGDLGDLDGHPF